MIKLELIEGGKLPKAATRDSAAMDCYARLMVPMMLPSMTATVVDLGFKVKLEPGIVGLLFARSGLAARHAVNLGNGVGVIDADYDEEVRAILANHGPDDITINPGDRVCQISFVRHEPLPFVDDAKRSGGFGSTGA